jgi:hypothetical protein
MNSGNTARFYSRREYMSCSGRGFYTNKRLPSSTKAETFIIQFIHLTKPSRVCRIGRMTLIYYVLLSGASTAEPEQGTRSILIQGRHRWPKYL